MPTTLKNALIAASALAVVAAIFIPQRAILHIDADEPVLERVTPPEEPKQIGMLHAGMDVPVIECDDVKTMFYFKIKLSDGRSGFVAIGPNYRREIRSFWSAPFSSAMVFNCL